MPRPRPLSTLLLALGLGVVAVPAVAAIPAEPPTPAPVIAMQHASWTAGDGAPTGIYGIRQTPDGWLWIGSTAGLFRFDGVRFQRAEGALAPLSSNIQDLGLLADGTLWVSYKFGGISLMRDGAMRHFRPGEHAMPPGTVFTAGQDGAGRIWIASSRGLRVLAPDGTWRAPDAGLAAPSATVTAMLLDSRGVFWIRTAQTVFALARHGARFAPRLQVAGAGSLAEHPDGSIWASDLMQAGLHLVQGVPGTDPNAWNVDDTMNVFLFDRAGNAWKTGIAGVTRFDRSAPDTGYRQRTDAEHGLSGPHPHIVFEDREQNVWVGTDNGLDRFRAYRLRPIDLPRYLGEARPLAPAAAGGAWVDRAFLARPDAAPAPFAPPASYTDSTTALHAAPDGTLWSGGLGGLWKVRDGRREAVPMPPGLDDPLATPVLSLASDAGGALWVALGRRGTWVLRDGRWSARGGGVPELASFATIAMAADAAGRMWLGSTDDELRLLDKGTVRRFGRQDGLHVGTVLAILPAAQGAWVGGENGLAWFDGQRFVPVAGRGGEPFAGTSGLVFARDGTLWLNGGAGLSAIAPAELRRALADPAYRVRFDRLDYRDGLFGNAAPIIPLPSAIRTADGMLWFSTTSGVFAFDPAALAKNPRVPPVFITALRSGERAYPAHDGLRLAPRTDALALEFTALGYRAPERMAFRYRLDGVDRDWQDATGRSAHYTNLAPGRYRFRVIAANDDGIWNEEGASLSFEIAPSLVQTSWFRGLCVAAALGVLWLLHRLRLRRMARRLAAQMDARLAERERIARELHDTLLQSVQGLVMKLGAAVQRLREDERRPLEEALEQAGAVIGEGRDRVAGLRGERTAPAGLAQLLADDGAAALRDGGVRFDVVTVGTPVALDAEVAAEVREIAREAVRNAFAHAQARAVTVTLRYAPRGLTLTVADDGCGIPADVAANGGRPGHWGLAGMRERAARIQARLDLATRVGEGTTWTLDVPVRATAANVNTTSAFL
ncbi:sensor histidine kinase [uncultured Massilia sp.]|uniref:sensor histidine kinase n=1 Tax=uncultured Massilia sp. TaxID=169973 RepID=UPI0025FFEF4A|nr:sensor histidine kinase [uncultured Massilia sp.]